MVFGFCRKVHGTRCGLLAVIVVATMPLFLFNARTVIFDIALALFVCGAIFAGYLAEATEGRARRNWYLLGAASAGLATLVKGPVGFLIPVLVLLVFNRIESRRGAWLRIFAPLNLAVSSASRCLGSWGFSMRTGISCITAWSRNRSTASRRRRSFAGRSRFTFIW